MITAKITDRDKGLRRLRQRLSTPASRVVVGIASGSRAADYAGVLERRHGTLSVAVAGVDAARELRAAAAAWAIDGRDRVVETMRPLLAVIRARLPRRSGALRASLGMEKAT